MLSWICDAADIVIRSNVTGKVREPPIIIIRVNACPDIKKGGKDRRY